jgi:hypothetical protein
MAYLKGPVFKGPYVRVLDERFGGQPEHYMASYQASLEDLEGRDGRSGRPLGEAARDIVSYDAADHFARHWLGDWWPEAELVEETLRQGFLAAIRRAHALRVPIETLCVRRDTGPLELCVAESPQQVTVLIMLPPPPEEPATAEQADLEGITTVVLRDGEVVVEGGGQTAA